MEPVLLLRQRLCVETRWRFAESSLFQCRTKDALRWSSISKYVPQELEYQDPSPKARGIPSASCGAGGRGNANEAVAIYMLQLVSAFAKGVGGEPPTPPG